MSHATGAVHKPHVLPLRVYLAVATSLLVLTVVTVWVSYLNVGPVLAVVIAMAVATVKASLVTLFFMHLKYDERFNGVVFISAFVFLSLFFVFTLADTTRRGEIDPLERGLIQVLPESSIPHGEGHGDEAGHGASARESGEAGHDAGAAPAAVDDAARGTEGTETDGEPAGGDGGH